LPTSLWTEGGLYDLFLKDSLISLVHSKTILQTFTRKVFGKSSISLRPQVINKMGFYQQQSLEMLHKITVFIEEAL
jgi:hypothetical protein